MHYFDTSGQGRSCIITFLLCWLGFMFFGTFSQRVDIYELLEFVFVTYEEFQTIEQAEKKSTLVACADIQHTNLINLFSLSQFLKTLFLRMNNFIRTLNVIYNTLVLLQCCSRCLFPLRFLSISFLYRISFCLQIPITILNQ